MEPSEPRQPRSLPSTRTAAESDGPFLQSISVKPLPPSQSTHHYPSTALSISPNLPSSHRTTSLSRSLPSFAPLLPLADITNNPSTTLPSPKSSSRYGNCERRDVDGCGTKVMWAKSRRVAASCEGVSGEGMGGEGGKREK